MSDQMVKFSVLCSMFNWMQRSKSSAQKRSKFRKFLDNFCKPGYYFSAIRLILPSLDRERGTYGLKESVLATCLIDAIGMSRDSEDALRLMNWRKGGAKTGANAGNFALVAAEVLQRRQGMASGGLTIKELNDLLDRLASSENRAEKTNILSDLITKTNAQEMKWIIMIILKDLKLGISEKSIFHEFHPDAEDLFNVTCDLKLVCEKLRDRSQRHKRQDIEVGKAVRPQLAMRVADANAAWKKLHGKEMVVECKFDGDRIQIHKNGTEIHFFSRNFLDHSEYRHAMSTIIIENILVGRCILDGEMLVWDTSTNRFAEFGSNQEIAKGAREGLDSDRQLCYVAFDILYVGDTSVIHQSLKERHELLRKVVRPLKGRLEILLPNGGLDAHHPLGDPCWSLTASSVEDIERFFKETIENRDEGIVLKDLGSKWEPSDRSGKWLKLKPDYIHPSSDMDILIIGGYYGSGRRGGEVAQFLMGLAQRSAPNVYPRRFVSFCRVGTGLSDEELDTLVNKLKPYFRRNEYPKKAPPSFYDVTHNSKERPDVWIDSPEKSVILSISSDIRTIRSEVFAAPYSLRFPRIDRVRYDKPWHECLDVQYFVDLVHSSNGNTHRGTDYGAPKDDKPKRVKSSTRGGRKHISVVPSHFIQTDTSRVKETTFIFANMVFYFVNVPPMHSLDFFHKMVAENGGSFSMNLNDIVTHCIAAEQKGIKYQAAKLRSDIIHYSWILDCCSQKRLLHLQPKYYLFLSDSSKKMLLEEVDEFSDSYYWDLHVSDLKQLFRNIERSGDPKSVDYYKKKYCPMEKWCRFQGICIYFWRPLLSIKEWEVLLELAVRRLRLEISIRGGEVTDSLSHATHLVVLSELGSCVDFDTIFKSFSAPDEHLVRNKRLHVVEYQWLEDSLEKDQKLQEEKYSLKPSGFDNLLIDRSKNDPEVLQELVNAETKNIVSERVEGWSRGRHTPESQRISAFTEKDEKQRRGRPRRINTKRGGACSRRVQRTRARLGNRRAKIDEYESDSSASSREPMTKEDLGAAREPDDVHRIGSENMESQVSERPEGSETSHRGDVAKEGAAEAARRKQLFDKAHMIDFGGSGDGEKIEGSGNSCIAREDGKDNLGKLEMMIDPVQSMLLNMIPSLGMTQVENTNSGLQETNSVQEEKPRVDSDAEPVKKKKKVSYKDVAGDLLKDW
ncbi:DNA ligase 4 isoform X2 [Macadamia integrifolia]|uniref:DNA ligase 4 isoform X2 n=1 Tax=Macadamia integrifolia TaxID=60698 RepID=UPI001C4FBD00|nr:DNA ligase 4 isoform X2 [Macadamia integrifolia]